MFGSRAHHTCSATAMVVSYQPKALDLGVLPSLFGSSARMSAGRATWLGMDMVALRDAAIAYMRSSWQSVSF